MTRKPYKTWRNPGLGALPELPDGGYQVSWRVVSADGHPISGSFGFRVGNPAARPPAPNGTDAGISTGAGPGAGAPGWLPAAGIAAAAGLSSYLVFAGLRRIKRNTLSPSE